MHVNSLNSSDLIGMSIFTGILAIPFFIGAYYCARILATKSWPQARGTIVRSEIERVYVGKGGYSSVVHLLYDYEVGGVMHQASRVYINNFLIGDPQSSGLIVARYPRGRSVAVYYNPLRPGDAMLEQSLAGTMIIWMVLDALVCAGNWGMVLLQRK